MASAALHLPPTPAKGSLTGWKVLLMLVAFFGVVGGVNAIMIGVALTTFRGEVTDHPYEAGLAFNSQIDAARAQEDRHWNVSVHIVPGGGERALNASFLGPDGAPLTGLDVKAFFAAPADLYRDIAVDLHESAPGAYTGATTAPKGVWDFKISASRGGDVLYRSLNRVKLD
jgi:nitrogen fixation protein FixH